MRRRVRKTFSKERIIMAVSSVLVLGGLTAAGLWIRQEDNAQENSYVVDFSSIENDSALIGENVAGIAGSVTEQSVTSDDLDYDPYFQEANSGNVENPDASGSESMSDGVEQARANTTAQPQSSASATAAIETAAQEENENTQAQEDAQAISTAMQPTLSFSDGDSLVWPVVGNVLVNYSMDKTVYFPTLDQYKYNPAIIIQANEGDMITAAAAGKVTSVFEDPQIGHAVIMDLGNGYEVTYGQLTNILVSEGSYVSMGDMIAQVAAPTKYFSIEGTNVYFKLTKDGEPINPMTRLN